MGKGKDEIKLLVDIDIELQFGIDKLIRCLARKKDSPDEFYGFMYDTDDNASISGKSSDFLVEMGLRWIHKILKLIGKMIHTMKLKTYLLDQANDQDEALFDQEVVDESFNDEEIEQGRPIKWIRVSKEEIIKDEKTKNG
nr:hypothetical protein [Tanacetum cinerariifolium]